MLVLLTNKQKENTTNRKVEVAPAVGGEKAQVAFVVFFTHKKYFGYLFILGGGGGVLFCFCVCFDVMHTSLHSLCVQDTSADVTVKKVKASSPGDQ